MIKTEQFVKEFDTSGSYPSLFECNDGERYVVKHSQQGNNYNHIINEYIAANLAQKAKIPIPDFSLIEINDNILPRDYEFARGKPNGIGFGSRFLSGTVKNINDISFMSKLIKNQKKNDAFRIIEEFISICAFDIWLRNNDRSPNNPNLLVNENRGRIGLIAIDHSCIFAALDYSELRFEIFETPPEGDSLIEKEFLGFLSYYFGLFFKDIIQKICDFISSISDNEIEKIVYSVPEVWLLTENEKKEIINFINTRKSIIANQFSYLLKQIGL